MHHSKFDRAHLHHLGSERSELQHLLVRNPLQALSARHDARVTGVNAIDIGIDVAALGGDGGRDRNRGGI